MLVLNRRKGDWLAIIIDPANPERDIRIKIVSTHKKTVTLGFEAPKEFEIHRAENLEKFYEGGS